jgi:hypothetical protein
MEFFIVTLAETSKFAREPTVKRMLVPGRVDILRPSRFVAAKASLLVHFLPHLAIRMQPFIF